MFGGVLAGVAVAYLFFGKDAMDKLLAIRCNTCRDARYFYGVYADAVYHVMTISNEYNNPIAPSPENFAFLMVFSKGSMI